MGFKAPYQIISLGREAGQGRGGNLEKSPLCGDRGWDPLVSMGLLELKGPRKHQVLTGWWWAVSSLAVIQDRKAVKVGASELLLQQSL